MKICGGAAPARTSNSLQSPLFSLCNVLCHATFSVCAAGTHTTSGECPSACYPCPVGHYSSTPTSSCSRTYVPTRRLPQHLRALTRFFFILACKANTYASHTGSVACTPCPAHSSTPTALGASTCVCNPGYVSNGQTGDGLVCTGTCRPGRGRGRMRVGTRAGRRVGMRARRDVGRPGHRD